MNFSRYMNPLEVGVRGTSPGMPKQNILAMLKALEEFNENK